MHDSVPVKAVWCSAQCSGGGCPDETWLLAVLSRTEQHLQQPIRSKPQGLAMPVKPLFHAYYTNVTDAHECCTLLLGNIAGFFFPARKYVYDRRHIG